MVVEAVRSGAEAWWTETPANEWSDAIVAAMKLGGVDNLFFVSGSELTFKIEIGVPGTARTASNTWVLGDATRGRIDSTWVIAGDYDFVDVTNDVQSFTVDRTRNREFDMPEAGTASVVIRDDRVAQGTARRYDPSNTASVFYPSLVARSQLRISAEGKVLFTGDITNLDRVHSDYGKTCVVRIDAADVISRCAATQITYKPEAVHNSQKRMARILERGNLRFTPTFFLSGSNFYQVGNEETGSVLDLLQAVVFGERGFLYANTENTLVMLTNAWISSAASICTFDDGSTGATFKYSEMTEDNGNELMVNDVTVDSIKGDVHPVHRRNDASITKYGVRSWPGGTIKSPVEPKELRRTLASAIVNAFPDPVTRFKSVTVPTVRYLAADRQTLLGIDLGGRVTVKRTPLGTGSPAAVSQTLVVVGVHHEGHPNWLESTFTLSPLL